MFAVKLLADLDLYALGDHPLFKDTRHDRDCKDHYQYRHERGGRDGKMSR